MTQTFTKDNTVLAKLFAEEDIHVVHRQAHTASFDVKKRELVLPILKKIVSVGRIKWIPDTKSTGKDNCCWYLFDRKKNSKIHFFGKRG